MSTEPELPLSDADDVGKASSLRGTPRSGDDTPLRPKSSSAEDASAILGATRVLIGGEAVNKLARYAAAAILARALGLSAFGIFNVGIAAAGIAIVVTNLGLPDVCSRHAALRPGAARAIARAAISIRLTAATTVAAAGVLITELVAPDHLELACACGLLVLASAVACDWLLRGLDRPRTLAAATAFGGTTALVVSIVIAVIALGPAAAVGGFALAELAAASLGWLALRRGLIPGAPFTDRRDLLRESWPIAVSGVSFYLYFANLDTLILAGARSDAEAGLYSAAYRLFLALTIVGAYVSYASLPVLARLLDSSATREAAAVLRLTTSRLLLFGALTVGLAAVLGRPALTLLFGHDFGSGGPILVALCVGLAWYSATYPIGYALIAEGKHRAYMLGALVGGVSNLILCLLLIPTVGAQGAAYATLVSFASAGITWMIVSRLLDRSGLRQLLILLALTVIGIIAAASSDASAPIGWFLIVTTSTLVGWPLVVQRF